MALVVTPDGSLEVRAPLRMTRLQIDMIVQQKSNWIQKQQDILGRTASLYQVRELTDDARVWYLGRSYPIRVIPTNVGKLHFSDGFTLPAALVPQAADSFTAWYKTEAQRVLSEHVEYFARLHHLKYRSIRITSARTRWGSCSAQNALSFSWRLVMTPLEIIDYIAVHELAHTIEKNHGRSFWQLVESILPDYRRRRTWLKLNGRLFDLALNADETAIQEPIDRSGKKDHPILTA